jgi:hypothetical protein
MTDLVGRPSPSATNIAPTPEHRRFCPLEADCLHSRVWFELDKLIDHEQRDSDLTRASLQFLFGLPHPVALEGAPSSRRQAYGAAALFRFGFP